MTPGFASGEEPVLASDGDLAHGAFGSVAIDAQGRIVEIPSQCDVVLDEIGDRLVGRTLGEYAIAQRAMFKRRLKTAGLPPTFSCHSCRNATATNLLEQGVELADVQNFLGHAEPRTTKLYDARNLTRGQDHHGKEWNLTETCTLPTVNSR